MSGDWKTDDWVTEQLSWVCRWCCENGIHPNVITGLSMLFTIQGLRAHGRGRSMWVPAAFVLSAVMDCLDGATARLCNLTSKLGGYLDTVGDVIRFTGTLFIAFSTQFSLKTSAGLAIGGAALRYLYKVHANDATILYDHAPTKDMTRCSSDVVCQSTTFATNNLVLTYAVLGVAYMLVPRFAIH